MAVKSKRNPMQYKSGKPRLGPLNLTQLTALLEKSNAAIVYRLGHRVFIPASGVRFPVAVPSIAQVVELVDTLVLEASVERRASSSLALGTKSNTQETLANFD